MSPVLTGVLADLCRKKGLPHMMMTSGPAHDAAAMGQIMPAALMFVPSKGGLSHCPQEDTAPEDLAAGAELLEAAVRHAAGCRT
jgi:acetylornithine deacetylase/succinyl-diaminopimelate desuccinylase-like protein